ncbi:putative ribonuclease H-like domain-containing protein [Tanacetum coccineum]
MVMQVKKHVMMQNSKDSSDVGFKPSGDEEKKDAKDLGNEDSKVTSTIEPRVNQGKDANVNSTNNVNAAGIVDNVVAENIVYGCADDPNMPELEEIGRFSDVEDDILGAEMNNLDTYFQVSPVPTTSIHKDQLIKQIIGDLHSIEAMQEELLQFKLQHVWTLMDLPNGKRVIGTKWEYKNKKDERAIRLFLAYASFKDFVVYQMDVKSDFFYSKIEEEVYVCQRPSFEDPDFPDRVYKVEKVLYGLHQAPRACDVKTARTPMETQRALLKDADGEDVDEHLYRSMIGSLMHLTSSRPDIMFAVCACARFQVNPKSSHLHAVKRIFRYLKGQPKLGLWYLKDSPFDLVAYTDSDYIGASLDRKSTIGGYQFLGCRLI